MALMNMFDAKTRRGRITFKLMTNVSKLSGKIYVETVFTPGQKVTKQASEHAFSDRTDLSRTLFRFSHRLTPPYGYKRAGRKWSSKRIRSCNYDSHDS